MKLFTRLLLLTIILLNTDKVLAHHKLIGNTPGSDSVYYYNCKYMPTFNSGWQALNEFFNQNIKYPGITGWVNAEFIVERNGSLSHINVTGNASDVLKQEAIRLLQLCPSWKPGLSEYKGKKETERIMYFLPLTFTEGKVLVPDMEKQTLQDSINNNQVFTSATTQPAFPGDEKGFAVFLNKYVRYPKIAKDKNVTGRVFIQFIVEVDGTLTHFCILRDPGSGLGDEGVRVLSLSPKWIPGKRNDVPVRVHFTIPINYSLAP